MAESWKTITAAELKPGDTVRTGSGHVLRIARIEDAFMGRPGMLGLIEDSPGRWFKAVSPADAEVEVLEEA
jgi:hypothetical protein